MCMCITVTVVCTLFSTKCVTSIGLFNKPCNSMEKLCPVAKCTENIQTCLSYENVRYVVDKKECDHKILVAIDFHFIVKSTK